MQECNELAEQGKNKDCFGCSCSICLSDYKPLNNELDELKAKAKEAEARVEGLETQLTEALEESTKLQNEAILLAMDYERAQNALDTLRHVLEDAATRVKVLQAVADVARQVVINYKGGWIQALELAKALAALDGIPIPPEGSDV